MGKSSKAPAAPDPVKTAQAESQFNRVDEYRPNGGGIRYGFTNAQGQFQQGVAPAGHQSAVKAYESPTESHVRQGLEWQAAHNTNSLGVAPSAPQAWQFGATPAASMPNAADLPPAARFSAEGLPALPNAPTRSGSPVSAPIIGGAPVAAPRFAGSPVAAPSFTGTPGAARFNARDLASVARPGGSPSEIPDIERALFNRSLSLMQPEMDRQANKLQSELAARGLPVGGAAWADAVSTQQRGNNETLDRLAQSALLASGQEQSRRYGLQADARDRAMSENLKLYDVAKDERSTARGEQVEDYSLRKDARATAQDEQTRQYQLQQDARGRSIAEQGQQFDWFQKARAMARGEQDQDYALSRDASDASWNRALTTNDLRARERNTAISEQDRAFNLQNLVRQQAINEGTDFFNLERTARDGRLAEMAALMGGAYNPVGAASRIGGGTPINYSGMVQQNYANQMQQQQANQQSNVGALGALGNLGMAGYMLLSSRRWKDRLGEVDPMAMLRAVIALPLYRWRYSEVSEIGDRLDHVGPYAEDWQAATGVGDGQHIATVDAIGVMLGALQALAAEVSRLNGQQVFQQVEAH